MTRIKPIQALATVAVAGTLVALSGCSSTSSGGSEEARAAATSYKCDAPNADSKAAVSVTALQSLSAGALYAGVSEGFFAENGLDLSIATVSTIPAAISAVQGGTSNFGVTGTFALMQALQNQIPLTVVAPYAGIAPDYNTKMAAGEKGYTTEATALLTKKDSGLDSPGDLNGKTVAVIDVQGQAELTTRAVIDANGGDSSTVKFTVLSPADAYNALLAGQVQAAYSVVPIVNNADADGAQIISWPGVEALHEGPTTVVATTNDFASNNPETIARFNCALRATADYATANPDQVRAAYAKAQGVDPSKFATSVVPYFYQTIDLDGISRFEKLMLDHDFLLSDVDVEAAIDPLAVGSK